MWCWRRLEISWPTCVRNEVLQRFKEERNILQTLQRGTTNWIGHILCWNWLLKHVIEGKIERRIEVAGKWERRCKQLVDDLKEKRGYWRFKDEVLDHTLWRTHFGRGYGPVIRHNRIMKDVNNTYQFTCIKQKVPDDSKVHRSLKICRSSIWNSLMSPFLHPEF